MACSTGKPSVGVNRFVCLPLEILEEIWSQKQLREIDLANLALVCKHFKLASGSNKVWKHKVKQRWPRLFAQYPLHQQVDWKQTYHIRHTFSTRTLRLVGQMSPRYYHKDDLSHSDFDDFMDMMSCHDNATLFLIDELICIVKDGRDHENLTVKYYAAKLLRHIKHMKLKQEFKEFLDLPQKMQLVERGAVLISQWCQPKQSVTYKEISEKLDEIATIVREKLSQKSPGHPACQPLGVPLHDVAEDLWSVNQCRVVLETLNEVLFKQLGFRGNNTDYYDPLNSFIDRVLARKMGIPITMSIVYLAVARRLGIVCHPVNAPSHFVLKWKEHPTKHPEAQWTVIDAFNSGQFHSKEEMHEVNSSQVCSTVKVLERMARNLMNIGRRQGQMGDGTSGLLTAAELFLLLCPDDLDARIMLIRIYMHCRVNLHEVVALLQELAHHENPYQHQDSEGLIGFLSQTAQEMLMEQNAQATPPPIVPKLRSEFKEVIYSVGMIMQHKRYHYTCVIYGWDGRCEASQDWMHQMGVHNLPHKHIQPFYNVLVEDGSNRYAAQENLEPAAFPKVINHGEVGRYFKQYCHWCYIPNEEKRQQYPQDNEWTARMVQEHYNVTSLPGLDS